MQRPAGVYENHFASLPTRVCNGGNFLWSYNDLFTQLFFLRNPEQWTITIFLNEVSSQFGADYGMMCAVVTLIFVPVILVYLFLQKNIIRGLTAGAIKG